jgi:hypothetical protein
MDQAQQSWMRRPSEFDDKKLANPDFLQAYGMLAIAEALHRIADAMENPPRQQ